MPQSKEVHRDYMRKRREGSQDTVEGSQSVTKSVMGEGITLSDGQLWYPGNYGYHPKECLCKAHDNRTYMTDTAYVEMILEGKAPEVWRA